jgi:hypothetical protein
VGGWEWVARAQRRARGAGGCVAQDWWASEQDLDATTHERGGGGRVSGATACTAMRVGATA